MKVTVREPGLARATSIEADNVSLVNSGSYGPITNYGHDDSVESTVLVNLAHCLAVEIEND